MKIETKFCEIFKMMCSKIIFARPWFARC
jgi:hypothetical protein